MKEGYVFDIKGMDRFYQKDIAAVLPVMETGIVPFHPTLYKKLKHIRVKKLLTLIEMSDVQNGSTFGMTQQDRLRGVNNEFNAINISIYNNGYKFLHPAIAVYWEPKSTHGKYEIITGRSRCDSLMGYHFQNLPVTVYERVPGSTDAEVRSELSVCGQSFQIHDPAGKPATDDIFAEVCRAIDNGWIGKDREDIRERIASCCGNGVFTSDTRDKLLSRVENTYNPDQRVISWGVRQGLKSPKKWVQEEGYAELETDKVKYHIYTTENFPKTWASIQSKLTKGKENRILVHTGTLNSSLDLAECFRDRVETFKKNYTEMVESVGVNYYAKTNGQYDEKGVGNGLRYGNTVLYGVLPCLSSIHDLSKIIHFDASGRMFQNKVKKDLTLAA